MIGHTVTLPPCMDTGDVIKKEPALTLMSQYASCQVHNPQGTPPTEQQITKWKKLMADMGRQEGVEVPARIRLIDGTLYVDIMEDGD